MLLLTLTVIFMTAAAFQVAAAPDPQTGALIVWMDDPDEVTVRDRTAGTVIPGIGLVLQTGSTISTGGSSVELVLVPNESVIVIGENTIFRIDTLHETASEKKSNDNTFSLIRGKLRFIAARITGSTYSVRTQTAVAGVRGTDFYRMYDPAGGKDWLCVTEGAVRFDPPSGEGGVTVPAGSFVNLNNGFRTAQPDEAWLRNNLTLEFLKGAEPPKR